MSRINKWLILTALMTVSVFSLTAQSNKTTSPYSMYGYGVLSDKGIGASRGMGGISYGLRNQNINPGNPASYANVDSLTFIFDIGVSYSKARLSQSGISQNDDNGGLDYMGMQFKLAKWIGISAGLIPYSTVGYSFGKYYDDNVSYTSYYGGSGGLSQIYGGVAVKPLKGLSIGANISYLYGKISHSGWEAFEESSSNTVVRNQRLKVNGAKFDIGIQYELPIQKNRLIVGAVYSPSVKPNARFSKEAILSTGDTIQSGTMSARNVGIQLPHTFGLGFTFTTSKWMFGADATYQKWKDIDFPEIGVLEEDYLSSDKFNDRWRFNAGFEYTINPLDRNFFKRIRFRGGLNYSNSYLNVKTSDGQIGGYKEYGASVGFGIPFRDAYTGRSTFFNIAFEYTRLNPEIKNSMIKEEYFGVSLNVNLNDLWFLKNKFK